MESKKIYSLIVKDKSGKHYRLKINGSYFNTLAVIDAKTSEKSTKEEFCDGISYIYKLDIVDIFIAYKKNGHTKTLEPVFKDMQELNVIAKSFDNISELDLSDENVFLEYPRACLKVRTLANDVLDSYNTNPFVKEVFDEMAGFIVKEALRENNKNKLVRCLCKYRELRKVQILYQNALIGKKVLIYPSINDSLSEDIIPIEKRRLEIVNAKIEKINKEDNEDRTVRSINEKQLGDLYEERDILEANLNHINKEIKGQIRFF